MKVVILDGYPVVQDDLSWAPLNAVAGIDVCAYERTLPGDVVARCTGAEAVLTNKVSITADVMASLPKLRYIGVLATGYNVVDCEETRRRGIVVTNIPAYSTASVAQLVFAHLLNITNAVAHYAEANSQLATGDGLGRAAKISRWVESQDFTWTDTKLTELAGKTFCVYGLGNIGSAVALIAVAFGMRVLAVTTRVPEALPSGVEKASWEQALAEADVLSLHCPLTPSTRHMINAETLARMKPTAILINTGRGPLVDETAVADALGRRCLGAYAADVLATEPPSANNPLLSAPHCYLTPHIGWATREARVRLIETAVLNLRVFLQGKPCNVVS